VSFQEDAAKVRSEMIQRITVGVGLLAQALNGLSGVLHHAAQALEQLSGVLVANAIDEEFGEPGTDAEDPQEMGDEEEHEPYEPPTITEHPLGPQSEPPPGVGG